MPGSTPSGKNGRSGKLGELIHLYGRPYVEIKRRYRAQSGNLVRPPQKGHVYRTLDGQCSPSARRAMFFTKPVSLSCSHVPPDGGQMCKLKLLPRCEYQELSSETLLNLWLKEKLEKTHSQEPLVFVACPLLAFCAADPPCLSEPR